MFFSSDLNQWSIYLAALLPVLLCGLKIESMENYVYYNIIVYAHGRRLCSNWFRHGSTTISYPQCNLTFLRERYLHSCREQSFANRAFAMSAVGLDVVSVHKLFAYRVMSTVSTDIVSSHTKYRIRYHKIAECIARYK